MSVAAAIGVNVATSSAHASIPDGRHVTAGGLLTVHTSNDTDAAATADGSAAGSAPKSTSVGAAIAVNVVKDTSTATTARDVSAGGAVTFSADNAGASTASATASAMGADTAAQPADQGTADGQSSKQLDFAQSEAPAGNSDASDGKAAKPSAKTSKGQVSIAAAVGVNVATSSAHASIPDGRHVTAGGLLTVHTSNDTDAAATADGSAAGSAPKSTSVGAGVAVNVVKATNIATVGDGSTGAAVVISARGLTVESRMNASAPGDADAGTSSFTAQATSGVSRAGGVSVAGSLALNVVTNTSQALLEPNAQVTAGSGASGDNVALTAENNSAATASATASAAGGSVGVGASVALTIVTSKADAKVLDGVSLTGAHDVRLSATSANPTSTTAEAGSSATGGLAIGGAVGIGVVSGESSATLGIWAPGLTATGAVSAAASHSGSSPVIAKGEATGGKAAIGAAIAVNVEKETATATTSRDVSAGGAVTFSADNAAGGSADSKAGAQGADAQGDAASGSDSTADGQMGKELDFAGEMSPPGDSDASDAKASKPHAKTSRGQINVAAAIGVNVETSSAHAYIPDGRTVTAGGALTVHTSNDTDAGAKGDGSAASSAPHSTSVGAGIAINYVNATNLATIGDGTAPTGPGATVSAHGITVEALMHNAGTSTFDAEAVSGASGSGGISVAGSLALNIVTNTSQALIEPRAQVTAGTGVGTDNVALTAENTSTTMGSATSNAAGGTVGIGASVALDIITSKADAQVLDGATLTGAHDLTLRATSVNPVTTTVQAGGAATAGVGVGASVAIAVVSGESSATLGTPGGTQTVTGDLSASASHAGGSLTSAGADAAGSSAAVGAAIAVNVDRETATATTTRDVSAGGAVTIRADNAGASSANTKAGAQGADADSTSPDRPKSGDNTADGQMGEQLDFAGEMSPSGNTDAAQAKSAKPPAKTSRGQLTVAAALGVNVETSSAHAYIPDGLTITAGGPLTVHTSIDTDGAATADGSAAGSANAPKSTSIGAGVAINVVRSLNRATIGDGTATTGPGATVSAHGVTVEALMNHMRPATPTPASATSTPRPSPAPAATLASAWRAPWR